MTNRLKIAAKVNSITIAIFATIYISYVTWFGTSLRVNIVYKVDLEPMG
jgi:hypothetical protein